MLTAEARIETERARRYLHQFCTHAAAMAGARGHRIRIHDGEDPLGRGEVHLHVDSSDDQGIITFDPWGRCILRAEDGNTLTVRVDATDEQNLHRIQDIITRDIERFGRRDQLTVTWQRPEPPPGSAPDQRPKHPAAPTAPRGRHTTIILTTAGALAIALTAALHLGLGGAAVAAWRGLDRHRWRRGRRCGARPRSRRHPGRRAAPAPSPRPPQRSRARARWEPRRHRGPRLTTTSSYVGP